MNKNCELKYNDRTIYNCIYNVEYYEIKTYSIKAGRLLNVLLLSLTHVLTAALSTSYW